MQHIFFLALNITAQQISAFNEARPDIVWYGIFLYTSVLIGISQFSCLRDTIH